MRRNIVATKGNPTFDSISNDWHIYPVNDYSNLGIYAGVCTGPIVFEFNPISYTVLEGNTASNTVYVNVNCINFDPNASVLPDFLAQLQYSIPPGNVGPVVNRIDMVTTLFGSVITQVATQWPVKTNPDVIVEPSQYAYYKMTTSNNASIILEKTLRSY